MYVEDMESIGLEELDIRTFIPLQESEDGPLAKLRFFLDTPYLKRDFNLDLIIWNLTEENLDRAERVVRYVLKNFNKLFETGWTALYRYLRKVDCRVAEHTAQEFFVEQIDFESSYYQIQLEINCGHLEDGQARYCFVVSTTCDYRKWMIADDDMRVYMIGNKACGFNDNNDDGQMQYDLEDCEFYGMGPMLAEHYAELESEGFRFAEPFRGIVKRNVRHEKGLTVQTQGLIEFGLPELGLFDSGLPIQDDLNRLKGQPRVYMENL